MLLWDVICGEADELCLILFPLPCHEGSVQPEGQRDVPHLSNETRPHTCDVEGGGAGTCLLVD